MTVAETIKARRLAHGWPTQATFAKAIGMSQATVSRWESGTRPDVESALLLQQHLGGDVTEYLGI